MQAFVARIDSQLLGGELSTNDVAELVESLHNALEEVRTLHETICLQSDHLAAALATAHAERERYRYLFEHAPDAYLVSDLHGLIREANPQASTLLNTPLEFLIGVPLANFVNSEQRPMFRREFARLGSVERVEEWRVTLQPHNMPPIQASLSVSTVPEPSGRHTVLRWLLRDITERTAVATLWRAGRNRQQAICTVAKTPAGLEFSVQTDGSPGLREVFATWEEVLRRAHTVRATMKVEGWQEVAAMPPSRRSEGR